MPSTPLTKGPTAPRTCAIPDVRLLLHHCQLVAVTIGALEEQWGTTTLELPMGDDGNAVPQQVSFIHVVCGEQDGPP